MKQIVKRIQIQIRYSFKKKDVWRRWNNTEIPVTYLQFPVREIEYQFYLLIYIQEIEKCEGTLFCFFFYLKNQLSMQIPLSFEYFRQLNSRIHYFLTTFYYRKLLSIPGDLVFCEWRIKPFKLEPDTTVLLNGSVYNIPVHRDKELEYIIYRPNPYV